MSTPTPRIMARGSSRKRCTQISHARSTRASSLALNSGQCSIFTNAINAHHFHHEGELAACILRYLGPHIDHHDQFGKEIQSQQIPGWSQYYLDYKALKKIISAANKSIPGNASPFVKAIRPSDVLVSPTASASSPLPPTSLAVDAVLQANVTEPLAIPVVGRDEDRGPEFQRSKAMFFFKLERELEKVCSPVVHKLSPRSA